MIRILLALLLLGLASGARADTPSLDWQKWDASLFDRAGREDKYILLHMAAVWCHWCHVMERTTYRDAAIQQRIAERFIPVRVDQDSDPALSYRYENWGWPATIILDKDGNEIFKRRGYLPPELFGRLLAAVIDDPSALPSYQVGAELAEIIVRDHRDPAGGFMVRQPEPGAKGVLATPVKQIDENVATVRLLALLARSTGRPAFRHAAQHGMRYLIALAEDGLVVPGALLADRELGREPAHVTIVGAKDDPDAQALYAAARSYPTPYLRIDWLDRREGPLPASDIDYPEMPQAAAFACANGACSIPVFAPEDVHGIVAQVDDR